MNPRSASASRRTSARRMRGTSLLEALVAFLVLSLGMLTVVRLQTHLRASADVARQRSEAVRLAQQELENLRAFSAIAPGSGARAYADIVSGVATLDDAAAQPGANTRYTLTRAVLDDAVPNAKSANLRVTWDDRSGSPQQIVLDSLIAGVDPAYSGALGVAPSNLRLRGALARAAEIPILATDLGNGSSAFKPVASGTVVLVFDNRSGVLTSRCTSAPGSSSNATLSTADLVGCTTVSALLLSGSVRFSAAAPPDAANANEAPLPLAIALATSGGSYASAPQCTSEAQKTVGVDVGGRRRLLDVSIDATAASLGFASWQETGARFVAYHCVVYPLASGRWSGRATIVASGWTIGAAATDWRVCRFSADLDGSGAVDANIEHPGDYSNVGSALANQNFLVVKGDQACPAGVASSFAPGATAFAPTGTVVHQP
ncbi:MAG: hypothetical protein ABIO45_15635 [Burkholderiaceae bacterium]